MPDIKPSKIRLEASSACQLKCASCYRNTEAFRSAVRNGFLKFGDFRKLVDENPWIKEIELSNNGEIFLNPELLEMIKHAHELGIALTADNGVNLNAVKEAVLEGLVKYRFKSMTVSIDGASSATYRVYRVGGNFETVIENIRKINLFKQQYQSEYPQLLWQFIAFGHNEHEIDLAEKMARALGMNFYVKLTWDDRFSPLRNPERIRKLVGAATREEYKQRYGVEYFHETCHQLWDGPQVNWDGKVLGCCRNWWGDFGGNAFEDGLLKSINSEKTKYARDMLLGKKKPMEGIPCTTCSMYMRMKAEDKWLIRPSLSPGKFEHEYDLEKLQVITPKNRDFQMLVAPRYITHYCKNVYEDFTSDLVLNQFNNNTLFVDIGAHYGYYTILVGKRHPNCKIIAFEPVPENFEILKRNVALNQLKNTELHNLAISDSDGLRKFNVAEASDSCGFYEHPLAKTCKEIQVKTVCLDNFLKKTPKVPTIIKIDTEGHEVHVLQGMRKFLGDYEDIKLVIEFNPKCLRNAGHAPEEFLKEVSQLGFDIYAIDDNKRLTYKLAPDSFERWIDYMPDRNEMAHTNILCIKKEKSLSVCFFSHSAYLNGAERSLLELATELVKDYGVVCSVILPSDGPLKQRLEEVGVSTHIADYFQWFDSKVLAEEEVNALCTNGVKSILYNIKQTITKINPDIVVTNTMSIPWGAITASFLGKPHVWFIREFGEADHSLKPFMPFNVTLDFVKNLSDLIITNSDATRKALFPDKSSKKVLTVYPYVNIPSIAVHQDGGSYFTGTTSTKLIITGPVKAGKGQTDAVLAVKELVQRGKDVELIIMGHCTTDDYAEHLKTIVREENLEEHVKFVGFEENPYPIVNQSDIVLVCSRKEAFGRVTVEGMLLKKPVIGTNKGGTLELIKDGVNGLLYGPGHYNQLAAKIEYLIDHPDEAKRIAENGYEFAKKTLTKSKFGGKVYKVLRNLKHKAASQASSSNLTLKGPAILDALLTVAATKDPKITAFITELGSSLTTKDAQINSFETSLHEKVAHIAELEASFQEKVSHIAKLETSLQEKGAQIAELETSLQEKVAQIAELETSLQEKSGQITSLETNLQEKSAQISSLETNLQEKVSHIANLETSLQEKVSQITNLEAQIQQIQRGIVVQLMNRYQRVVEKLLRRGTRRRHHYELMLTGIRIILNEGCRSFFKKVRARLQGKKNRANKQLNNKSPLSMYQNILKKLLPIGTRRRYYYGLVLSGIRVIRNEGWRSFWSKFKSWLRQRTAERKIGKIPPPPTDMADDWSDYRPLSRKIIENARRRLESYKPKSPKMISIAEDNLAAHARSLQFPAVQDPQVSIVIPVYNNDKLTIECLTSILRNTKDVSYEVILIDDGPPEKTKEVLPQIRNITYLRNPQNLGFLLSCDCAAEKARGEFLLILHSDVQVTEGWLHPLVDTFSEYEKVGAVSPKILFPDGRLQEAGARIKQDASSQLIGLFEDPGLPRYNYTREVEYCSGVCLLVETEVFRKLGGFDSDFAPAYCDSDLCFRLRKLGKRIFYNPNSVIVHYLSATAKVDSQYKQQCVIHNQQKFSEKWQEQIDAFNRVRLIAFYLPQYHPIPENDLWWGKGFTEWTRVTEARPNFVGHYQPHLPGDLGFYDLRIEEVVEQQAEQAKRYGIYGFCFYYYWFSGKRLLDMPLERMLKTGKPDIPFCLCWANDNWTRRWVHGSESMILIAQRHSDEDDRAVIRDIIRYMRRPNYIRINGKPLFLVYRADLFPDIRRTVETWRAFCRKEGVGEVYLAMIESFEPFLHDMVRAHPSTYGFDASVECPPHMMFAPIEPPGRLLNPDYKGAVHDYREVVPQFVQKEIPGYTRFRTVSPGWDDTPRRQDNSNILVYSSPGAYQAWLETILELTLEQNFGDERIVFINAWNEWAEGMYLEPDRRFGHGFLEATRNALGRSLLRQPSDVQMYGSNSGAGRAKESL
jgi:FkbM family methyltransferase